MLTVSGDGDGQASVGSCSASPQDIWAGEGRTLLRKGVSSIGLSRPAASLLGAGRQCKSDGTVTGTQIVSAKRTEAPVSLAAPSCKGLSGSPGLKSQAGRTVGGSGCTGGPASCPVRFGAVRELCFGGLSPGLHRGVGLKGPLSHPWERLRSRRQLYHLKN